jgi:hypothetical protein
MQMQKHEVKNTAEFLLWETNGKSTVEKEDTSIYLLV